MKVRYILFVAAALAACAACARIVEQPEQEGVPMTYRAYLEGATDTKTTVQDGGTQVLWEPADEIKVFFKSFSGKFVSQNSEPAGVTDFSGTLSVLVGAHEGFGSSNLTWGLYPYREDASYDGEGITTTLPALQTGREGSFARDTHISLAQSSGNDLAFYNVTGGLRFSLTQEGFSSVSFRGNDGEALAGTIQMAFEDGVPVVTEVSVPQSTVTLTAPDGGTFHTGKWYYIETIPVALTKGFTMVFSKGSEAATLTSSASVSISRGKYGSLADADEGLEFKEPSGGTIGEPVDLGLSVKWASWNVGASKPEEYGDYFAWGETEPKDDYYWKTYKWCNGSSTTLTKYCPSDKTDYWAGSGSPDGKTALDPEDDAASVNWGDNWRMPTDAEMEELINNCTWTWTSNYNGTGIHGRIVTSKKSGYEDRSIFLPAAGYRYGTDLRDVGSYGNYWSSSLDSDSPDYAWNVRCYSGGVNRINKVRYLGQFVRPVYGERVHPESVKLSHTNLSISAGFPTPLMATVLPENALEKGVLWSSDNTAVATVDGDGYVTALKEGTATITVTTLDGGKTAECVVTVVPMQVSDGVDLGLSVKWSSFNLGATRPEEYGSYFAWGETDPKDDYSWKTYKWYNGSNETLTKYCPSDKTYYWAGSGSPDGKTVLDSEDDAASVNWGDNWRMPTDAEWTELRNNCKWTWTDDYNGSGISGRIVTSKKTGYEDRSIFLPAAGVRKGTALIIFGSYGYYLSSSLRTDNPRYAWHVSFYSGTVYSSNDYRNSGFSVRPVYGERIHPESVKLSHTTLSISVGFPVPLMATVLPENALEKSVVWSSDNTAVATVDGDGYVTALKEGTATITVTTLDGGKTAECVVTVVPMQIAAAVDLGLSVKWSSFNLGATRPEEYGSYFAWGESEPKYDCDWDTYKWCNGSSTTLTKYCLSDKTDYWAGSGSPDGKTVLDSEDDAASANWGGSWRMPTDAEWTELRNNCTWTWTDDYNGTGISGWIVTSKKAGYEDRSIFLPAAGYRYGTDLRDVGSYGNYWSSSLGSDYPYYARRVRFYSGTVYSSNFYRLYGYSVRPVTK